MALKYIELMGATSRELNPNQIGISFSIFMGDDKMRNDGI